MSEEDLGKSQPYEGLEMPGEKLKKMKSDQMQRFFLKKPQRFNSRLCDLCYAPLNVCRDTGRRGE